MPKKLVSLVAGAEGVAAAWRFEAGGDSVALNIPAHADPPLCQALGGVKRPVLGNLPAQYCTKARDPPSSLSISPRCEGSLGVTRRSKVCRCGLPVIPGYPTTIPDEAAKNSRLRLPTRSLPSHCYRSQITDFLGRDRKNTRIIPGCTGIRRPPTADFCEHTADNQEDTIGIAPDRFKSSHFDFSIGTGVLRFRWKCHLRAKSDQSQVFAIVWRGRRGVT